MSQLAIVLLIIVATILVNSRVIVSARTATGSGFTVTMLRDVGRLGHFALNGTNVHPGRDQASADHTRVQETMRCWAIAHRLEQDPSKCHRTG